MTISTHQGRITCPVPYKADGGATQQIPVGPCLVENLDGQSFDISWGSLGQRSAALALEDFEMAQHQGHLVLLS